MSTNSTIAVETLDGYVFQVYCHWDGYLSNNGKILLRFYSDRSKVEDLIAKGDISSLGDTISATHFYEDPKELPLNYDSIEQYHNDLNTKEEYNYIFTKDDKWLVCFDKEFLELDKALVIEALTSQYETFT